MLQTEPGRTVSACRRRRERPRPATNRKKFGDQAKIDINNINSLDDRPDEILKLVVQFLEAEVQAKQELGPAKPASGQDGPPEFGDKSEVGATWPAVGRLGLVRSLSTHDAYQYFASSFLRDSQRCSGNFHKRGD